MLVICRFSQNLNSVAIEVELQVGNNYRKVLEKFIHILIVVSTDLEVGLHHYQHSFNRYDLVALYISLFKIQIVTTIGILLANTYTPQRILYYLRYQISTRYLCLQLEKETMKLTQIGSVIVIITVNLLSFFFQYSTCFVFFRHLHAI